MLTRICVRTVTAHFSHTIQPTIQPYLNYRQKQFTDFINTSSSLPIDGHFTSEGSTKFSDRHNQIFMKPWISDNQLKNSNIGIGTYKGSLDTSDDILQFNSIIDSVLSGVNVIDTCANFRGGRSQIVIGAALKYLFQLKKYSRNQLLISTKAGYVRQKLPQNIAKQVINDHCVHPTFLQHSLNNSLEKMGLKTIDIFYLNNFAESQLQKIGKQKYEERLAQYFQFCQKARNQKKIKYYGLASWQSFRLPPNHPLHLNFKKVHKIAEKVGGRDNGFKFLQVPINIMMPETFAQKNQQGGSLLQTCENLKINLVSCSPLLSGSLINIPLPTNKLSCRNNGAKHLQIIRSIPSPALTCTLIGQKTNRHTKKNLQALKVPLLSQQQWFQIFVPQQQPNQIKKTADNQVNL